MQSPLLKVDLPGIPRVKSGKVRELFDLGSSFLMVATDRISAFDCVMPNGIPGKGEILTRLSHFWFDYTEAWLPNHRLSRFGEPLPRELEPFATILTGRSMVVGKAVPLPIECVVRGWLAGSGWKEYQAKGSVCGVPLPVGLREGSELPFPIFTPATKADSGHDENIGFGRACDLVGAETAAWVKETSLRLYGVAREYARTRGVLIADTKFEFGWMDGRLHLIDEVLTPDSSRFWPIDLWAPGVSPPSFDKQYLRDYLEQVGWDKRPPAPVLPQAVVDQTAARYAEALSILVPANYHSLPNR